MMGFYSIVAFFQKGGLFMYPIMLVFAVGMAITIERWLQLSRTQSVNSRMWDLVHPVLAEGEFDKAREMVNKDKSNMANMLEMGLARQGAVRRREDIEIAMEESMMEIIPQLEKRTPYVALLANIATLLGLLGTIMGLIEAFTAVANANPAEKGGPALSQHFRGHEHHCFRADVGDPASSFPCHADVDHGPDRGQPGDGIGKGAKQHLQFRHAPIR
jgi:biopolymer transport protein ExbB